MESHSARLLEIHDEGASATITTAPSGPSPSSFDSVQVGGEKTEASARVLFWDGVNVLKNFIGTNVLTLPYAFREGGVYATIAMLTLVAVVTEYCIRVLIRVRNRLHTSEYGDMGEAVFGRGGRLVCEFALIFTQFGGGVGYAVFLTHNLHHLVPALSMNMWLVVLPLAVFPLCAIRSVRKLAPASLLSNASLFVGLTLCQSMFAMHLHDTVVTPEPARVARLPILYGICAGSLGHVGLMLPLEESMGAHRHHFMKLVDMVLAFVGALMCAFGLCGYLAWGNKTHAVITLNFPMDGGAVVLGTSLIVAIVLAFPMQVYPVETWAERLVRKHWAFAHEAHGRAWLTYPIRLAVVAATALVAFAVPFFGLIAAVVGSVGASTLAFTMPTLFHRRLFAHTYRGVWGHVRDGIILTMGVGGGVLGAVLSVTSML